MHNLLGYKKSDLDTILRNFDTSQFRCKQIEQWIHGHGISHFNLMNDISQNLKYRMSKNYNVYTPKTIWERVAKQDGTRKSLICMKDGNAIESVFIPEKSRGTLCVSSQIGCGLNCSFCSTGKSGFNRNLSSDEIIGQIKIASRYYKVTNLVMMGMGEPLLNYDSVISSLEWALSNRSYNFSKNRITISTSGVVPNIEKLKQDLPVCLAVSLHAANNPLRDELVPINKKYPLESLMQTCAKYFAKGSKQKIMFEYTMLKGVNDSLKDAKELSKMLKGISCKINMILFNSFPGTNYVCSTEDSVIIFYSYLVHAGHSVHIRRTRGGEVYAACGQLLGKFFDKLSGSRKKIHPKQKPNQLRFQ